MVAQRSTILGPDGQPIMRQVLSKEVAAPTIAGVRRVHEERVATHLTPEKLGTILRAAAEGNARDYLTLAEEMEERYLHYASQLQTRRLAIESVDVTVEAAKGIPTKIVDFTKELLEDGSLLDALGSLTDGIAKSYAAAEIMWEYERGYLRPVEYIPRDQRFFQFDRLSLRELRLAVDGSIEGEELPAGKFLRHLPRAKMGIPLRRGLARPAAWAFMIQSFGLQDWAGFSEVYGMPLRVGKYHAGASESDKRTLLRAVAAIANDAAAIIPDGMSIDFHSVAGTHGEAVFAGLLEYCDKQISKLVVGQTMTSDDGSSLGQAKIHNEVRLDILRADCRQLAHTITRDLVEYAVAMNFGPQEAYPQIAMPVPDPEDLEALTKGVVALVPLGLRVSEREMREKFGLSEPADDERLLTPSASAGLREADEDEAAPAPPRKKPEEPETLSAHAPSCRCSSCIATLAAEAVDSAAVDELDAVFAGVDDWQEIADPLLSPLLAILDQAQSFDEALAMLEAAGPDGTRLRERLTELTALARGIGDVAD
ncbi:MAG: DUF935 domain-containing protein [Rhizobiaceae bacterium]|nr:DUF935 domain-containing protein [Rhizobiaceae bacterium]